MPRIKRAVKTNAEPKLSVEILSTTKEQKTHANSIRPDMVKHIRDKLIKPQVDKPKDNRRMISVAPEVHAELKRISQLAGVSISATVSLMIHEFKSKF